jgi:alkanesulfonate monooxygenase SsuD/methylene tetrahydromethanopterin reductase-like flavin-dependent oxidoreductase (luciferase family)
MPTRSGRAVIGRARDTCDSAIGAHYRASMTRLPALSVIGTPTKRQALLDVAAEADRRGFAGLASPGIHGNLALCGSLAHVTSRIPFWTSIQPIYHTHHAELAVTAGHLAEVSNGRFRLGLGVSHAPAMGRLGIATGKPLSDMRASAGYRLQVAQNLLHRFWLQTRLDAPLAESQLNVWARAEALS